MTLHEARQVFIHGPRGLRLGCRVLGASRDKAAILTSGIGCGPVFLDEIARELARDHRVIYWDYRGHGTSGHAPRGTGYSIAEHAADLDCVVRTWASDQPLTMVGFSMGVQVTVEWIRRNPQRASSYVFMLGLPRNPVHRRLLLRSPTSELAKALASYGRPVLSLLHPLVRSSFRSRATYRLARSIGLVERDCPPELFYEFIRYATDIPLDTYLRCCAGILAHDATDVFRTIRQPVLMIACEDDVFVDANECCEFAEMLPQARLERLRFASHAGSLEFGGYVAARVRRFLTSTSDAALHAA